MVRNLCEKKIIESLKKCSAPEQFRRVNKNSSFFGFHLFNFVSDGRNKNWIYETHSKNINKSHYLFTMHFSRTFFFSRMTFSWEHLFLPTFFIIFTRKKLMERTLEVGFFPSLLIPLHINIGLFGLCRRYLYFLCFFLFFHNV